MTGVIVWLWDAPGASCTARGVCGDHTRAQEAAGTCLASGQSLTATIQAAELVDHTNVLDPHYARFGCRWEANRAPGGEIRWRELMPPTSI